MDVTPTRPALRYYGGKWRLAPWIISYFPQHTNYLEPCGGAASVLLQKPRSRLETYNDVDGNVVNFFRVARTAWVTLIEQVSLTPWARDEYELCMKPSDDPIEAARRFFVTSWMSFNGSELNGAQSGWRHTTDDNLRPTPAFDLYNNEIERIAARLRGVQIECGDWRDVMAKYDGPETLIYFDPPYVPETRTNETRYVYDWPEEEHLAAGDMLNQCAGMVIVSGYACAVYEEVYEERGWQRIDRLARTNGGKSRVESLWLSPRTVEALSRPQQIGMQL